MCFDVTHPQKPSPQVYTKSAQRQVDLKSAAFICLEVLEPNAYNQQLYTMLVWFISLAMRNGVENLEKKGCE